MKMIFRIYKWIVISLVLQLIMLVYINNIYLNNRGGITITTDEVVDKPIVYENARIPTDSKNIKISFDGMNVAYILDGKIEVIDLSNRNERKNKKIIESENANISYFRWLPDRNMLIYSAAISKSDSEEIEIPTYDVQSGDERSYPKITKLPKDSEVQIIELSPLTNLVYTKIKTSQTKAIVYKYNIMDQLKYIMNISSNAKIIQTKYADNIIIQDDKNKLSVWDGLKNTTKQIAFSTKMVLLGNDGNDNVYVGQLDNSNKVSKIYFGKLTGVPNRDWEVFTLITSVYKENIYIESQGNMYYVNDADKYVINLRTSDKIKYSGEFKDLSNGCFVSVKREELIKTPLKEDNN